MYERHVTATFDARFLWEWNGGILSYLLCGILVLAFIVYQIVKFSKKLKEKKEKKGKKAKKDEDL